MWIDCLPLTPPSCTPAVVFLSSLWHFAVWHFHAKYELQNAFQTDRTQNESNEGRGRERKNKKKEAEESVGEREWAADSEERQWQAFTACNFDKGRSSSLQLFPYTPPPPPPHNHSCICVLPSYHHVCASLSVCLCVCVLGGSALFFYALRRIAHKTFLLLI